MSSNHEFGSGFSKDLGNGFGKGFYCPKFGHNFIAGVKNDLYTGYYADDLAWFNSRAAASTTYPTTIIQDPGTDDGETFSRRWAGYFKPLTTETYTFFLSSDDASIMWLGDTAKSGWNLGNAVVDNSGLHGVVEKSGTASLEANRYYALQVFFGENTGGDVLTFSYSTPSISKTTNLTGLIFYNPVIDVYGRAI